MAKQEENHKNGGKFISDNDLRKEITQLKKSELSWLKEVSNNIAKQAVKDACNAYKLMAMPVGSMTVILAQFLKRVYFYKIVDRLKSSG